MTIKPRMPATSAVAATANTYAEASSLEERNMNTSSSTPVKRSQLTRGM